MITEIQTTIEDALEKAEEAMSSANKTIVVASMIEVVEKADIEEAKSLLLNAESYSSFVEADKSEGFHNPTYALSLINAAIEYASKAESVILEALSKAYEAEVSTLEAERTKLDEQVSTLEGQVSSLQEQVTSLQVEVSSLQGEVESLTAQVATVRITYLGVGIVAGIAVRAIFTYLLAKKK